MPSNMANQGNTANTATKALEIQRQGEILAMEQGRRLFRVREYVDFYPSLVRMFERRFSGGTHSRARDRLACQPSKDYARRVMPTSCYQDAPAACMPSRFYHSLQNKYKNGINACTWTRDGRSLMTGSKNSEITFWDAISMKYEKIISGTTNKPIRVLSWSHDGRWMLSGCHGGIIQWWDQDMLPMNQTQAHSSPDGHHIVRDIAWAPFDTKFATCSDDKTIKVWTVKGQVESVMTGHRWDVLSCDWHPSKPLLVSGSKDNTVKLWDARVENTCVNTFTGHKHTVLRVRWNPNGMWFARWVHLATLTD